MIYPRIAERNPVFHTVTKLLKTQICIIIKIINHAYILPATILFLENLWKEEFQDSIIVLEGQLMLKEDFYFYSVSISSSERDFFQNFSAHKMQMNRKYLQVLKIMQTSLIFLSTLSS